MIKNPTNRAVFLDRDGVLMQDTNYVGNVERVILIPSAIPALQRLYEAGYMLFVVTNQSGVARGYFTREAVDQIHLFLNQQFNAAGVHITHYYICPHHPEDNCDCRKPHPKNILAAARDHQLDLRQCVMVGDRATDIQTGINAGTKTALVLTGAGKETLAKNEVKPDFVGADLLAVADWLLKNS
jgi:D-glycero-D-manno-heptose 1,7-bisphosphate phosphatase